jgi:simple sugar transport system substrate-binding protein
MSPSEVLMTKYDPKVEEAIETLNMKDGPTRRRLLKGTGLVSATAAASALLAACGSSAAATGAAGSFPKTPKWKFTFVNHVTDISFFVPTRYGFADCAALLGLPTPAWVGASSQQSNAAPPMVSAINAAVAAKSPGIATTVIDTTSFTAPVARAMQAGIPVISYNADGAVGDVGTNRLAYVGQDLYVSGQQVAERLAASVPAGGTVVGMIGDKSALNLAPRIQGAYEVLKASPKHFNVLGEVQTGTELTQVTTNVSEYLQGNGSKLQGIFAVDGTTSQVLGPALAKYSLVGKVASGAFDLNPPTLTAVKGGQLASTIDQQPYLQGFLPTLYLYLFNLSGGLVTPPETDTGLRFVTKSNVDPYLSPASRFEGSTTAEKTLKRSGPIVTS